MYSLTYGDFSSYGIDMSSIDPRQIQMTHLGVDIPVIITGENDGVFNTVDEIIFYGEAMTGDFTNTNIYWLSIEPGGGTRMAEKVGTPDDSTLLTSFRTTMHEEQDNTYWSYMPDGQGKDHWFWDDLYGGESLNMTFSLNNISSSVGTATVRVMLYGMTDLPQDPDHRTRILLNGVQIDDAFWNGQGTFLHEIDVPHSSLLEGNNTVTVNSMNLGGVSYSIVYVNYAEIEYRDSYTAENDTLRFDGEGTGPYNMEAAGFSQSSIMLYDITDPLNAASITGADIQPDSGSYSMRFKDILDGENRYIALTNSPSQYLTPQSMESDTPSILKDVCNRADYIIIHHDSFDVTGLISALSGRGLALMSVKVSDIYDEFNYGIFDPQAIKDFLTYAYNNYEQPRPAYVVLVGDANQDYFNRYGFGINYVPTHIIQTDSLGDTASDNWFVSVSGADAYPDMFLGRISVRTQAELDNVVSKIANYELDVPQDGWGQNVLMVADDQAVFEDINDGLIQDYLGVYNYNKVYLSQYPVESNATLDIINHIDSGSILTIYTGHGSVSTWAGEKIFEITDIPSLDNPDRLTFVVALDCLNGWFSYYDFLDYSLAEEFLLADGKGAVGMWAATGLGIPAEHEILAAELFKDLFHNKEVELGPLTTGAKISAVLNYGISPDALEIFTLFGDPSTNFHLADINIPPTSDPGGPYTAVEGVPIILDGSGSIDPDGTIELYEWDFDGNGTYDYSSSSPTKDYIYTQEDSYTIKLRVTDDRGGTDEATTTVVISDSIPTADFTGSPTSGLAPLSVDFTNSSTGHDQPLTYQWDFDNNGTVDSTDINPFHIYSDPGTYTVKLKVTDSDGSTNTLIRTNYISVSEYTLTIDLIGSGRVVSSPGGIDCATDCTEIYDAGTVVTLTAEPADPLSYFMGWTGGGCSGTDECVVTMNDNTEVTAEFYECPYTSVRILDSPEVYYSIQDAYDDTSNGDTIQSQARVFDEDLYIDRGNVIAFESGFDCNYVGTAGNTILEGNMTMINGEITMQRGALAVQHMSITGGKISLNEGTIKMY